MRTKCGTPAIRASATFFYTIKMLVYFLVEITTCCQLATFLQFFLKWLVAGVNMEISFRSAHFSYFLDVLCTNRIEVSYYAVRIMFL